MRRIGKTSLALSTITVLAALVSAVALADSSLGIRTRPRAGTRQSTFVVSFRVPETTGVMGTMYRRDVVSVNGPASAHRCIASMSADAPPATTGMRVKVKLDPQDQRSRWCLATYHGTIDQISGPVCVPIMGQPRLHMNVVCPEFVTVEKTIGKFSFRVERH